MGAIENIGMKLYDVPRGSKIRVLGDIKVPPAALGIKEGDELKFHRIDGVFSECTNSDGKRVYLSASAQVEIINTEEDG